MTQLVLAAPDAGHGCGLAQAAAGQCATYEEHVQAWVSSQDLPVGTDLFEKLFARFVDAVEAAAPTLLLAAVKRPGFPGSTVSFLGWRLGCLPVGCGAGTGDCSSGVYREWGSEDSPLDHHSSRGYPSGHCRPCTG